MKTKYWVAMIAAVAAACLGLSVLFLGFSGSATAVEIWSDGEKLCVLPLAVDTELTVQSANGTNVITVKDGAVAVTEADCPDHYCMKRGYCNGGAQIVCLPNRLVILFLEDDGVDTVIG